MFPSLGNTLRQGVDGTLTLSYELPVSAHRYIFLKYYSSINLQCTMDVPFGAWGQLLITRRTVLFLHAASNISWDLLLHGDQWPCKNPDGARRVHSDRDFSRRPRAAARVPLFGRAG